MVRPQSGVEKTKLAPCGTHAPVAVVGFCGSSAGECRSGLSAMRLMVWRDSKSLPLIGPTRRHVHQTRNAEAAWETPVDRRLDDVRSEESQRKSHARRSFADAFSGGDRLDANLVGNYLIEPSSTLGDSG